MDLENECRRELYEEIIMLAHPAGGACKMTLSDIYRAFMRLALVRCALCWRPLVRYKRGQAECFCEHCGDIDIEGNKI